MHIYFNLKIITQIAKNPTVSNIIANAEVSAITQHIGIGIPPIILLLRFIHDGIFAEPIQKSLIIYKLNQGDCREETRRAY